MHKKMFGPISIEGGHAQKMLGPISIEGGHAQKMLGPISILLEGHLKGQA